MSSPFTILVGITLTAVACLAEYNIDDSLLYKIEFPGHIKGPQLNTKDGSSTPSSVNTESLLVSPNLLGEEENMDEVVMTSVDKEKFLCRLPRVEPSSGSGVGEYTGPTVLEILEKLFTQQTCAYKLESYWTYELCHGRHLRQYHEEREGKTIKMQEYSLGKFTKEMLEEMVVEHEKDKANGITRHPATKKIENMNMPYYEVVMPGGTNCDLNNKPRRTRVLYVCYPAGKNEVYSLKEVSTCEYEVVVLTNTLCSHPDYRPEESAEHGISCRPMDGGKAKPARLSQLELEGLKIRSKQMFETHVTSGDKPGQVRIEIKPVNIEVDEGEVVDEVKEGQWKEETRQPFKPLMDPQVVQDFLKGDYCLYGGSGWWKYEFCYGRKVDQYHEEGGGKKTVINLGKFNEKDHLDWLDQHPSKRPKPVDSRKQVSIFYSGGEVCDLTGLPRQIEVKMKCKPADSPSTVSLYLLEPRTCEYVLGVESPLVCDILPHADTQSGLFPPDLVDSLKNKDNVGAKVAKEFKEIKKEMKDVDVEELMREFKEIQIDPKAIEKEISDFLSEKVDPKEVEKDIEEFLSGVVKKHDSTQTSTMTSEMDGVKTVVKKTMVNGFLVKKETSTIKDGVTIKEATDYHDGDNHEEETGRDEDGDEDENFDIDEDDAEFLGEEGEDDLNEDKDPEDVEKEINDFLNDDEDGEDDLPEEDNVEVIREEL